MNSFVRVFPMGVTSLLPAAIAIAALTALSGCYYGHLAVGQTRLLWASRPIEAVLEDAATSDALRSKLQLVRAATRYADDMGLDVAGQYTAYLPWPGDRVITTVVATRPAEVEAAGFSFPFLGTLPYKGFFRPEHAEREAGKLRERGLDVCVSAVTAYSTLGWLDDPITEPMLQASDGRLVETIVHELVHATVYAKDEPEFNESVATFIGQEAAVAFFDETPQAETQRARVRDARLVARVLGGFRRDVESLYSTEPASEKRSVKRAALEARIRSQLSTLPLEAADREEISNLAQHVRLNDACLALRGTYTGDLERHAEVFDALGGDLSAFIIRLRRAAETDDLRGSFFNGSGEAAADHKAS